MLISMCFFPTVDFKWNLSLLDIILFFFPGGLFTNGRFFPNGESQILGYWFGLFGDLKPRVLYRHGTPLKYPLFGSIDWWFGDLNLGSCRGKMDNYPKATFNQTTNSNHQSKVN